MDAIVTMKWSSIATSARMTREFSLEIERNLWNLARNVVTLEVST